MSRWKQIWFALWCAGAIGCGDVGTDSASLSSPKTAEEVYLIDARGTYLRTAFDRPQHPTVIALEDIGASAGDTLRLGRQGAFKKTRFGSLTGDGMAAVFSESDELRSSRNRRRVVDAIDAGIDVSTPRTFLFRKKTDIDEDFEVTDSVDAVVPSGATHLFITAIDNYFRDNMSLDFAISVQVVTDGNLCEGVNCDDSNECTDDACDPLNGSCENAPVADGTQCDFGGLPGICGGGVCQDAMLCQGVDCDDSEQCTDDSCDPLNGSCDNTAVPDGTECDADGSLGLCVSGVCEGADLCEGTDCDDSNECTDDACDPADGQCGSIPVQDGTACNFSGLPGLCMGGLCQDAMLCQGVVCDDGNQCTDDGCDPLNGQCASTPMADGTGCNFNGQPGLCNAGACEDAMLCQGVACDDGNDCTDDTCDPQDGSCGSTNVSDGTSCDFAGLPGICGGGVCQDAMLCQGVDCDDNEQCTDDCCDPLNGQCGNDPVPDGTACDFGGLPGLCNAGACEDALLCQGVACDDSNACTDDACDPADGQCGSTPVPDGTSCEFGGLPGICGGGVCQDALLCQGVNCDDSNECTDDACDPLNGSCGNDPVPDGTSCNFGGLPGLCNAGACEDALLCQGVNCDDSEQCTDDACDPLNGSCGNTPVPDGTGCNFGGLPGICGGGVCQDALLCQGVNCDDSEQCTDDACDPLNGSCGNTPVPDGTGCNFGGLPGICGGGVCQDALLCQGVNCDDSEQCTDDACDPLNGSCGNTPVPDGTGCDFGGLPGICGGGVCQDALLCQGVNCDDSEQCTDDACDPLNGSCGNTPVPDGTGCNFGGLPGLCMSGACEDAMLCQGVNCDDSNACTDDACDPQDGSCGSTPVADGTACDFGGLPGICGGGVCQDAMLCQGVNCDDSEQCTDDACDPLNGSCGNTPVPDGTGCNFGGLPGLCMSGACEDAMLCQGVNCDDSNACTDDTCDPQDGSCGSTPVADGTACDFGGLPGICGGGVCQDAMLCQGVNCDDSEQCTDDACDPLNGSCGNTPVADGTACNFAGLPGVCGGGVCQDAMLCQGVVCNDANDCTADSCDPQDGLCDFTNEPAGTSCNAGGGPGSGMCDGSGNCNANPACGDGNLDPSELCDDGNTNNGDGCAGDCTWEAINATFNVCCNINAPIDVGLSDISVDATALPLTQVVAGQQATVSIDGTVDTSGIPVGIDATLVQPSTFTLGGTVGSSSSQTFPLPTPQAFNPGSNPILQLGAHQFLGDVDAGANQVCVDVTDTAVTATIFGSTNTYACTPGTCAGVANAPVCLDVAP